VTQAPPPLERSFFPKPYADVVQKLRVASGFVLLIAFAWLSKPSEKSLALGVPISLFGLFVRSWATGHLAKNETLATGGPFAYVRNPLYAGTVLTALGIVVASQSLVLALLFAAIFFLVYLPVIELEEQHLRSLFPQYGVYAKRVSRFLPLRKWPGRSSSFAWPLWKRNQEYKALLGFGIALCWMIWRVWSRPAA
jgi:protein-S-isoprenylcysteine O-methyltransferase Ste14